MQTFLFWVCARVELRNKCSINLPVRTHIGGCLGRGLKELMREKISKKAVFQTLLSSCVKLFSVTYFPPKWGFGKLLDVEC